MISCIVQCIIQCELQCIIEIGNKSSDSHVMRCTCVKTYRVLQEGLRVRAGPTDPLTLGSLGTGSCCQAVKQTVVSASIAMQISGKQYSRKCHQNMQKRSPFCWHVLQCA